MRPESPRAAAERRRCLRADRRALGLPPEIRDVELIDSLLLMLDGWLREAPAESNGQGQLDLYDRPA